ncbi:phage head-binding domain-containing protein [Salmonella enterica]|uniref:phage head-binding domain-containing protein n=1 Tax=Salmonella enterica TaxID=28901 RepID=UPI0009AAA857|nr:phage head-binding domain-containing protein [Salmonella enterica]EBS3908108.1 phage tail protein [Salmonella enterica subsp. enterica serovar Tilene]EDV1760629.1 phage tail protein [Salmonella enterica subsp. enterica serovar Hvittingfoss]EBL7958150.1 phage tail protein [Salmonella enterica]ECF1325141.1 phage tail protein [Salmonella enterica subsp. enterica serovar Tilene]ECU8052273.1 phage tail protein [Salmonella enterica subsp. enterica serovar Tilene]
MSDITANVVVSMPSQLFTLARSFKAAANGKIYIGQIDTDPVNPANQIPVYLENEDGSHVQVAQPIVINAGGYPVYNGQIAKFVTVQGHSMAVYDAYGAQQFYFPNILKYDPDQFSLRMENVADIHELMSEPTGNHTLNVIGYVPGTNFGGGQFYWDASKPKSQHNGITIFSPTVPWDGSYAGLPAFLAGTGETDGSGSGCWIRVNSPLDAIHTEWAGHDVTGVNDSTASVNACINKFGGIRPIRISPGTLKIGFPITHQYHDAFDVARPTSILITNKNSVHIYAENDVNINTDGNGEIERVCFGVINCTNFYFSGFKFNQTCTNFSTGTSDTTFTPQENWFGFEIEGSSGEIDDIDVLASRIFVMADVAGTGGTPNKDITVSRVRTELVTNYTFLTRNLDGVAKMLDCYMYRTGRTWHTSGEDFAASWDTKYMIAERNHFVNPISIQSRVGPWGVTNGAIIKSNVKIGGGIFVEIGGPANGTATQNVVIDGNVSDTVVNYDGTYSSHVLIIWNGPNDYQKSFNGIKITNNAFSGGSFAINDYAEMQMTNKCYGLVIESNQFNRTDSVKVTMPTWYKSIFKNNKVFITSGNTGCEIGGYSPIIDGNYFDSTYITSTSGLRIDEMLITNNLFSNSLSSPINQLIDMPKFTGMTYTNNRTTFTIRKFRNNADMIECGWHLADITAGFSAAPSSVYPGKINIGIGDIIHNAGTPSSGTNWAWYGLGNGTYGNLNIA